MSTCKECKQKGVTIDRDGRDHRGRSCADAQKVVKRRGGMDQIQNRIGGAATGAERAVRGFLGGGW